MAKRNRDPVFRELIRAVNESGQTAVPVTVTVRGTVLHAVDAWTLRPSRDHSDQQDRGPLADLLASS